MESNVSNELDLRNQNVDVQPAPGVAEDEYENKEIGADLTKADINRMAWRSLLLQASFNYERMQYFWLVVRTTACAEEDSHQ